VATPDRSSRWLHHQPHRIVPVRSDEVAPTDKAKYLKVYDMYAPLFAKLTPEASRELRWAIRAAVR
jgi:hypothetical protein